MYLKGTSNHQHDLLPYMYLKQNHYICSNSHSKKFTITYIPLLERKPKSYIEKTKKRKRKERGGDEEKFVISCYLCS